MGTVVVMSSSLPPSTIVVVDTLDDGRLVLDCSVPWHKAESGWRATCALHDGLVLGHTGPHSEKPRGPATHRVIARADEAVHNMTPTALDQAKADSMRPCPACGWKGLLVGMSDPEPHGTPSALVCTVRGDVGCGGVFPLPSVMGEQAWTTYAEQVRASHIEQVRDSNQRAFEHHSRVLSNTPRPPLSGPGPARGTSDSTTTPAAPEKAYGAVPPFRRTALALSVLSLVLALIALVLTLMVS